MKLLKRRKPKHLSAEAEIKEVKREWRNFQKFNDENRLLFAAFVVVLCALFVVNVIFIMKSFAPYHQPTQIVQRTNQYVSSQHSGTNSALSASIRNVTENDKKDYAFTIDPSETMLIMDITIKNTTNRAQQLIPSTQLYVRSNEGDYAQLHASMYVKDPLPSSVLAPGDTAKGQISFNVPKRVAKPLVYIDTGWDNYGPVIFDALK